MRSSSSSSSSSISVAPALLVSGSKDPSSVNIKVACRCRPANPGEVTSDHNTRIRIQPLSRQVTVDQKKASNTFTFDKVYDGTATQETIYNEIAAPIVEEVLNGYTCTIFAYGQTGTGKTYTMEGDTSSLGTVDPFGRTEMPAGAGIIPRVVNHMFDRLGGIDGAGYSVHVSHLELYNETICDLLSSNDEKEVRIMTAHVSPAAGKKETETRDTVILSGAEKVLVKDATEMLELMKRGMKKRFTAATLTNKNSSRSHCVFIIYVVVSQIIDGESVLLTGKLNLVDLAGSENMEKADTSRNEARKKETQNINKSLFNLGKVIDSLFRGEGFVPYRDSKLTRLLQDSLGGKTKTWIIATISPEVSSIQETIGTLRYGTRARQIKNTPVQNTQNINKDVIKSYEQRIAMLKDEIKAQREKDGCVYMASDEYDRMTEDLREKEGRLTELEASLEAANKDLEEVRAVLAQTQTRAASAEEQWRLSQAELRHTREVLDEAAYWLRDARDKVNRQGAVIAQKEQTEFELRSSAQTIMGDYAAAVAHVEALYAKLDRVAKVNEENGRRAAEFRAGLEAAAHAAADAADHYAEENAAGLAALKRLFDDFAAARYAEFAAGADAAQRLADALAAHTARVLDAPECAAADAAVADVARGVAEGQRGHAAGVAEALAAGRDAAGALAERLSGAVLAYSEALNGVQDALAAATADIANINERRAKLVQARCAELVQAAEARYAAHETSGAAARSALEAFRGARQRAAAEFRESCLKLVAERIAEFEAQQDAAAAEALAAVGGALDAQDIAVSEILAEARNVATGVTAAEGGSKEAMGAAQSALAAGLAAERSKRSAFGDAALALAAEGKAALGKRYDALAAAEEARSAAVGAAEEELRARYAEMLGLRRAACTRDADEACAALREMEAAGRAGAAACGGEEPERVITAINEVARLPGPALAEVRGRFSDVQKSACGLLYYKTAVPTGETPLKRPYPKDAFGAFLKPQKKVKRETPVKFPKELMSQCDPAPSSLSSGGGGATDSSAVPSEAGSLNASLYDDSSSTPPTSPQSAITPSSSSSSSSSSLSSSVPQQQLQQQSQQQQVNHQRRQSKLVAQQQQSQQPPPLPPPLSSNGNNSSFNGGSHHGSHQNSRKPSLIPVASSVPTIVQTPNTIVNAAAGGGNRGNGIINKAGRRSSKMPADSSSSSTTTSNITKQKKIRRPSRDVK